MRLLKYLAGLLLLPVCGVVALSVYHLFLSMIEASAGAGLLRGETPWLVAGFLLWLAVFATLPAPVRTYVFGHELTHVIWAWLTGGSVRAFHVGEDSGHVELTRVNFLVMLAPYFFPLYTMLVLLVFGLASVFADQARWQPVWLGLVGLTYGFHVTFTLLALSHRQTDVEENGKLFSYTMILLMNLVGIGLAVVAAGSPTLAEFIGLLSTHAAAVGDWLSRVVVNPLLPIGPILAVP